MIYDSVRQAKPTIRATFGVTRFNTRLNFYLFEINRLSFLQRKNFYLDRSNTFNFNKVNKLQLINIVSLDTTLFSYRFYKN